MGRQGSHLKRVSRPILVGLAGVVLAAGFNFAPGFGAAAETASVQNSEGAGVLPCKRKVALTAAFRANRRIHFEGVAEPGMSNRLVRIRRTGTGRLIASTRVRPDGTWWASASTRKHRFTWLSKFIAEVGAEESRWRRLGQTIAIRGRKTPGPTAKRTRIQIRVKGDSPERLLVATQSGCSRNEVTDGFRWRTNRDGMATLTLPRPKPGSPFAIYRIATDDGWRISPPIVVSPTDRG